MALRHFRNFFTATSFVLAASVATLMPSTADAALRHAKKQSHSVSSVKPKSSRALARNSTRVRVSSGVRSTSLRRSSAAAHEIAIAPASFGKLYGLHDTADALDLKSSVALVVDVQSNTVLFSKNSDAILPIASLTKLMTAVVVSEADLPMSEPVTITEDDVDTEKNSRSRLRVGTTLSREELLHLALMASENRAAHALGRSYPGGIEAFVKAMNRKARTLGMTSTRYVEPTGLSSENQSSAMDLAVLVRAAEEFPVIREFSTSPEYEVEVGRRMTQFHTTNALVRSPAWDIILQKTGFINEAGRCLVMRTRMAGRQLIMVFLDSTGKYSRLGDAERVRRWVSELPAPTSSGAVSLVTKTAS